MKYLVIIFLLLVTCQNNEKEVYQEDIRTKKGKIIVYGSDNCHSCIDTKAFLNEKKIKFTYYDIDINKKKEQEMLVKLQKANISIHTLTLPVIDNKGEIFLNKGNLKEFLKVVEKKLVNDAN